MATTAEGTEHVAPGAALATRLALLELVTTGKTAGPSDLSADAIKRRAHRVQSRASPPSQSIVLRAQEVQAKFEEKTARYKAIAHFIAEYSRNRPFLLPDVAGPEAITSASLLSKGKLKTLTDANGSLGDFGEGDDEATTKDLHLLSPHSVALLLLDAELELKLFEQNLRSCEHFGKRNIAGAGSLGEYERLLPSVDVARENVKAQMATEEDLARRALSLMDKYTAQVDAMSRIFVNWDQTLTEVEQKVARLERQRRL